MEPKYKYCARIRYKLVIFPSKDIQRASINLLVLQEARKYPARLKVFFKAAGCIILTWMPAKNLASELCFIMSIFRLVCVPHIFSLSVPNLVLIVGVANDVFLMACGTEDGIPYHAECKNSCSASVR